MRFILNLIAQGKYKGNTNEVYSIEIYLWSVKKKFKIIIRNCCFTNRCIPYPNNSCADN